MASRSKPDRRPERGSDSMEAVKPLIVLVLFGTILYGAYSVVQKGPSPEAEARSEAGEAPPFTPPAVDMPAVQQPLAAAVSEAPPPGPDSGFAAVPAATMPPPQPEAAAVALPAAVASPAVAAQPPAAAGITDPTTSASPTAGEDLLPAAAAAGLTAAAAAATADRIAAPPIAAPPASAAAGAGPPAPTSEAAPTYLAAESAPPPAQEDVQAIAAGSGDDRPERLALASQGQLPTSLPPEMPPPPGTLPSSAAFATAWADAHQKLSAGRYAEALTALSVWYDDPALGLEESHRLEDLLGQLAGTVIYSQQDLLLPPHVVAPGETLPAIAAPLGVSWQLLAKINGIADPTQLIPGERLKLVRGPFDAVVSVARRRLSLQVGGAYAGSFPVVVGREFLPRVGSSVPVAEARRDAGSQPAVAPAILLADGLLIQAADDPAVVADDAAPTSLIVSARDFAELIDILGPGSSVLVRQ